MKTLGDAVQCLMDSMERLQPGDRVPINTHDRAFESRADDMFALPPDLRGEASREVERAIDLCDSPIEQVALYQLAGINYGSEEHPIRARILRSRDHVLPGLPIHIVPQVSFGPYRVDFLVESYSHRCLAVECDGKAFHQDKERDARRDDTLLRGFRLPTYRIAGRDIWRNAYAVGDLRDAIRSLFL